LSLYMARRPARGYIFGQASSGCERFSSAKPTQPCAVCNALARMKCSACLMAWYCCADHQKKDCQEGHKKSCQMLSLVSYEETDAPRAHYWDMCEDKEGKWRAYLPSTDGSLTIRNACFEIGNRAVMMTWRSFVQTVVDSTPLVYPKKKSS